MSPSQPCLPAGLLRGIAYDSTNTPLEFTHMLIDEAGEVPAMFKCTS